MFAEDELEDVEDVEDDELEDIEDDDGLEIKAEVDDEDDEEQNEVEPVAEVDDEEVDEEEAEEEAEEDEAEEESGPEEDGRPARQASLEELLDQKGTGRKVAPETDEEIDIMAFVSERDQPVGARLPSRVTPIRGGQEFVCNRCRLVKAKVQLADKERGLCRDCV